MPPTLLRRNTHLRSLISATVIVCVCVCAKVFAMRRTIAPRTKLYLPHIAKHERSIFRCENIMTCPMREIGSGSEHCPFDWLAVYDGKDDNAPLIGKFCGVGKFPFSIIGRYFIAELEI